MVLGAGIKMKDSIRILLTEKCNANCTNCFNKVYRDDCEMAIEDLRWLSSYLSQAGIASIKVMGGEPTIHSSFLECIKILQDNFFRVSVFTNAISDNIFKLDLRDDDCVIYNYRFIDLKDDVNKLLLDRPGYRTLEVQITFDCDINDVISSLESLRKIHPLVQQKVGINLTLDCMSDIDNQTIMENVVYSWNSVIDCLKRFGWYCNVDHNIPICIAEKYGITAHDTRMCSVECSGLIDSRLNLRYCNQYPVVLSSLKKEGRYMNFCEVLKLLEDGYKIKLGINEAIKCNECKYFMEFCNGGCFMHKLGSR